MAIVVKHGSDPTGAIRAGFAAGQGATRNRFREGMLAATERRRGDERRLEFEGEQRGLDRDWRSGEAETAEERAISRARLAADLGSDAREQEFGLRDDLYGREQERRRDDIEWNYTTKQRQDFSRMNDALEEARTSGYFTDDEIKDLEQQKYTKLFGLEPVPNIKKRSPFPEGQGPGQTWQSDDGNFLLTRDDKGNTRKLGETNVKPTFRDRIDAYKQAVELSQVDVLDKDGKPTGEKKLDREAIDKLVEKILGTQDYNGANPEAVQRWGVGSGSGAEVDDSTDRKNKKPSPADRWAI